MGPPSSLLNDVLSTLQTCKSTDPSQIKQAVAEAVSKQQGSFQYHQLLQSLIQESFQSVQARFLNSTELHQHGDASRLQPSSLFVSFQAALELAEKTTEEHDIGTMNQIPPKVYPAAIDLPPETQTVTKGLMQDRRVPLDAAEAAQIVQQIASYMHRPPIDLFWDGYGTVITHSSASAASIDEWRHTASAALSVLNYLLAKYIPADKLIATLSEEPPLSIPLVREVTEPEIDPQLLPQVVLLVALYSGDGRLHCPWSSSEARHQAKLVLQTLAVAVTPRHGIQQQTACNTKEDTDAIDSQTALQGSTQQLLLRVIDGCAGLLRKVLPSLKKQSSAYSEQPGTSSVHMRSVAARELCWILRKLQAPGLAEAAPQLLPLVLACCEDPTAQVEQLGFLALQHIAANCTAQDLQWARELLLDSAVRAVTGCQETVWENASHAACQVVLTVEGDCTYSAGYRRFIGALLSAAENNAHKRHYSMTWLNTTGVLWERLGVLTVMYFSQLMPLLLRWMDSMVDDVALAALQVLKDVIRVTWPRMMVHQHVIRAKLMDHLKPGNSPHDMQLTKDILKLLDRCNDG